MIDAPNAARPRIGSALLVSGDRTWLAATTAFLIGTTRSVRTAETLSEATEVLVRDLPDVTVVAPPLSEGAALTLVGQGRDTASLSRMQVSAAEYAWLVYPSSPLAKPPYSQPPQIAWMLLRQSSDVGLARLVKRRGGSPLRILGYSCDPDRPKEGENTLRRCMVQTNDAGTTVTERLFGIVVQRHGRFKFLSYQNQY